MTLCFESKTPVTSVPDGNATSNASVVTDTVDMKLLVGPGENTSTATRARGI
jgi:hypothetical protein